MRKTICSISALLLILVLGCASNSDIAREISLYEAVRNNDLEKIQKLIDQNIDVDEMDETGNTPIMIAATNNSAEAAKLLIESGADINKTTGNKYTALMFAVVNNSNKVAKILLDAKADIYIRNTNGKDVYEIAKEKNNAELQDMIFKAHEENVKYAKSQNQTIPRLRHEQEQKWISTFLKLNGYSSAGEFNSSIVPFEKFQAAILMKGYGYQIGLWENDVIIIPNGTAIIKDEGYRDGKYLYLLSFFGESSYSTVFYAMSDKPLQSSIAPYGYNYIAEDFYIRYIGISSYSSIYTFDVLKKPSRDDLFK